MSSSTTTANLTSPVLEHLASTISCLNDYALSVTDIDKFMYQVVEDQCNFYGTNSKNEKFLLYRANVSDLTKDTDLFSPIVQSVEISKSTRQRSHMAQMLFNRFKSQLSGSGSDTTVPSFELEHGVNAELSSFCHSVVLVGRLNVNGARYKITFGKLIDFENSKGCMDLMKEAIQLAETWSDGLTNSNVQARLTTVTDGVKVVRTDGQEQQTQVSSDDDDDDSESMAVQDDDDASLLLAMKLQEQFNKESASPFDVFQQKKPLFDTTFQPSSHGSHSSSSSMLQDSSPAKQKPVIRLSDVKDKAIQNAQDARELLQAMIISTHPYKDITAKEVYNGIHVDLVPQSLGQDYRIFGGEKVFGGDARKWSYKVSYGKIYWMIPIITDEDKLITSDQFLEKLKEVAYFGPEINDLLIHWVKRGVFLSTTFAWDKEVDKDGKETTKRVCTMGMFKVDNLTCCPLNVLEEQKEGNFKKRIEIPSDIYTLKPEELVAAIQQNIHLFIDHMLEATGCSQPDAEKKNDVQTMVEALHGKGINKALEKLGAKLYWTFLTPKGIPNTLKLYIDLQEEDKRAQVYSVLRDFLSEIDVDKKWSFSILSEVINTVREWGKGNAMQRDPVPPLCVQMSWRGKTSEAINKAMKFVDDNEASQLRQFGLTTRSVVTDGDSEAIMVELHVPTIEKLPMAKEVLEKLLDAAALQCNSKDPKEALVVQQLDSAVQTSSGFKVRRPNTLSFAIRTVTGPIAEMINFLKEWSGVDGLKFSTRMKFDGSKSLRIEADAVDVKAKEEIITKLDKAISKAVEKLNGDVWLYNKEAAPGNNVAYSIDLFGSQGFGSGYMSSFGRSTSSFNGLSSAFGSFSSSSRRGAYQKPKPTQFDPGYGEKEINADSLNEIFDFSDDDL